MTQERIKHAENLARRYFDATATVAEERELRRLLADPELRSPAVDDARAVMGYAMAARRSHRHVALRRITAAAACAAVLAMAGIAALHGAGSDRRGEYMAYDRGHAITARDEVVTIIETDLTAIAEADLALQSDVEQQLKAIQEL